MSAALPLTDWIPCTTPPVREGVYEVRWAIGQKSKEWRATFDSGTGAWRHEGKIISLMDHTMSNPEGYEWRGVRRWVLKVEPCGCDKYDVYLSRMSTRGVCHWDYRIENAIGFETAEAAEKMRTSKRARDKEYMGRAKAVLP
jgi:hypothetical protein